MVAVAYGITREVLLIVVAAAVEYNSNIYKCKYKLMLKVVMAVPKIKKERVRQQ